jgi:dephospho-CoA kinase
MENKKVLAVVGLPGAGKTEVVQYLEQKGYKKVYFGEATFDEMKRQGLQINEENERKTRENLREKYGMAAFAVLALPKIKKILETENFVILESLYSWEEYLMIKKEFGDNFYVLAIYAPPNTRYQRLAVRPHRPLTLEQAKSRDYAQIEHVNIAPPITMADFSISNVKTKEELFKEVDEVLGLLKCEFIL